jgi:putative endonuclease
MNYFVYIVRCTKDDTLYTGYTTDVESRVAQHNAGKGAKYTRGRGPVVLVFVWTCATLRQALRLERTIKRMPRAHKLEMIIGLKEITL